MMAPVQWKVILFKKLYNHHGSTYLKILLLIPLETKICQFFKPQLVFEISHDFQGKFETDFSSNNQPTLTPNVAIEAFWMGLRRS